MYDVEKDWNDVVDAALRKQLFVTLTQIDNMRKRVECLKRVREITEDFSLSVGEVLAGIHRELAESRRSSYM